MVEYNIRNDAMRWRISTSIKVIAHFYALTMFEILTFQMFDLANLGQGLRAQHSQWWHSMANINLCKSHCTNFYVSSHRFRDIRFEIFDLEKFSSMSRSTTFALPCSMANMNLYKSHKCTCFASFHRFPDISKLCDVAIVGQGHDVQNSQWRRPMANAWLLI